jgi:hypothetical protein
MKQLLTTFLIVAAFSCSALKKSTQKTEARSSSKLSTSSVSTNKTDSAGKGSSLSNETKLTDSGYVKTTVIKEFFSDEFDFTGERPAHVAESARKDSAAISAHIVLPGQTRAGKLRYRETTTTEQGQLTKAEEKSQTTKQAGRVQAEGTEATKTTEVNSTEVDVKSKKKSAYRFLPVVAVFLFILLLLLFIISKLQKVSIWQILSKVTGL